ncbi:MAG TPA: SLBB domain-containing protein [Spirochaetales bacterium]|nr:SLBB domain-containing protein [Spirochaetales bacterium]HRY53379.1 SLBB domain-containing protein [Spirochaetia bacterium]HRZ65995.1 SLBB domain-containing protein [Spirochaetia bacterium]
MTPDEIAQRVKNAGVVGAGGAGFPTHVKLAASGIDTVVANGAECEPMLRCDQDLMAAHPELVVRGMRLVAQAVGAKRGIIALKRHYARAIAGLEAVLRAQAGSPEAEARPVELFVIEKSAYPAGDEFVLVYEVTGRIIPETGLPLDVGCVVQNVGTLANVALAVDEGRPVTHRHVTVNGEVASPRTVRVPVGMSLEQVIALAGGPSLPRGAYAVVVGGPMMGSLARDPAAEYVTKTTSGIVVLPAEGKVARFMSRSPELWRKRGKASCDQCRDCTILCPRNLLGHGFSPHEIMRAGAYGIAVKNAVITGSVMCCECRLCEAYSCPLELSPMRFYQAYKRQLAASGWKNDKHHRADLSVDAFREGRLVPTERLAERLGVLAYHEAPVGWSEDEVRADRVVIRLKQGVGVPATPLVAVGQGVRLGQVIGEPPEGKLGARVHASIDGRVAAVDEKSVVVEA